MADNELHYVDADSETIWEEMMIAYGAAGGDILYPGDEKEMLLRAVQLIAITILAKVDNALRMDTLTYAVRDYLKEYGKKRNCIYIEAVPATAPITLTMIQAGEARTLEAGTQLTADGNIIWETTEDIAITGTAQTINTTIRCLTPGITGNGLPSGTEMQFMEGLEGLESAVTTENASGGTNAEDEEVYRERIRQYGLASVTTGPAEQYERAAAEVSTQIIDVKALNDGNGEVGIYLLTETGADTETIYASVLQKLNDQTVRPLTDHVSIHAATEKTYILNVKVWYDIHSALTQPVADTIAEYQKWQDMKIGRPFNPDKLVSMLYQSGCDRVQILDTSSGIDGGAVEYTEISEKARCKGTITPTIVNT